MIEAYPLRVRPVFGEAPLGLLARMSGRTGISANDLCHMWEIDPAALRRGEGIDLLAAKTGHAPDDLQRYAVKRVCGSREVQIGGARTLLRDWSTSVRRFCPHCFAEDRIAAEESGGPVEWSAWHRPWWDVISISSCTDHRAPLRSSCPDCSEKLAWPALPLDKCPCGAALAWANAADTGMIGQQPSLVDEAFTSAIRDQQALPQPLTDLPLAHVSSHLGRVGLLLNGWKADRPSLSHQAALVRRDEGFLLAQDSGRMTELFDRIVAQAPHKSRGRPVGLCASYGWVWQKWLGIPTANKLDTALTTLLRSHASTNGVIAQQEITGDGITLTDARKRLGVGHVRMRRVINNAGLASPAARAGVGMGISVVSLGKIEQRVRQALDATQAAEFLGIGRGKFRALVREGIIAADQDLLSAGWGALYRRESLDVLIARLNGNAPILAVPPSGCTPLPTACRNVSIAIHHAVAAILSGSLYPVAISGSAGLKSILVTERELAGIRSQQHLSIQKASAHLGLHYEAGRSVVRNGLLVSLDGKIALEDVERFSENFCTSAQVGNAFCLSGYQAAAKLKSAGVTPVLGPPECRQAIYDRKLALLVLSTYGGIA